MEQLVDIRSGLLPSTRTVKRTGYDIAWMVDSYSLGLGLIHRLSRIFKNDGLV